MGDEADRVAAVYDRYRTSRRRARAWSATNPGNRAMREELARHVLGAAPARGGECLDIGCGTGWWLRRLADAGRGGLHGIELLPERVAAAQQAVPGAAVVLGDAASLPYADGRFELVTLLTVLSSMDGRARQRRALDEARRVLAPGGTLAVWEPRWPNPRNRSVAVVAPALYAAALPGADTTSLTLAPPLARRVDPAGYARLAAIPALRSHRLVVFRG